MDFGFGNGHNREENWNVDFNKWQNITNRNISDSFKHIGSSPYTRNKTKVFNYDISAPIGREESDPRFRHSVFNENLKPINIIREISIPKKQNHPNGKEMPPLTLKNYSEGGNLSSDPFSFGKKSLQSKMEGK